MNMQIMVVGNAEDAIRTIRHALAASGVFVVPLPMNMIPSISKLS